MLVGFGSVGEILAKFGSWLVLLVQIWFSLGSMLVKFLFILRMMSGSLVVQFGSMLVMLVQFGFRFGSVLVQCWLWWISVGSDLVQFGAVLVQFGFCLGSMLIQFGAVLAQIWFRFVHFGLCWLNFG